MVDRANQYSTEPNRLTVVRVEIDHERNVRKNATRPGQLPSWLYDALVVRCSECSENRKQLQVESCVMNDCTCFMCFMACGLTHLFIWGVPGQLLGEPFSTFSTYACTYPCLYLYLTCAQPLQYPVMFESPYSRSSSPAPITPSVLAVHPARSLFPCSGSLQPIQSSLPPPPPHGGSHSPPVSGLLHFGNTPEPVDFSQETTKKKGSVRVAPQPPTAEATPPCGVPHNFWA